MAEKMTKLRFSALTTAGIVVIVALAVLVFVVTRPSESPQQSPAEEETQEVVVGEDCDLAALESGDVPEGWLWRVKPALCIGYGHSSSLYPGYGTVLTSKRESLTGSGWYSFVDVTRPTDDGTVGLSWFPWRNRFYSLEKMRSDFRGVHADGVEFMVSEAERKECAPGSYPGTYCYFLFAIGEIDAKRLLRFQFAISVDDYSSQEALDLIKEMLKTVRVR